MTKRKVTKKRVEHVLSDASYLQREAEALTYVIEDVPHDENPPEGYSIAELLMFIDYAQQRYYKPAIEKALDSTRVISLNDFNHFKETFDPDKRKSNDIQEILQKLASHRGFIVNKINDISLTSWGSIINKGDKEILLIKLVEEMNHNDRVYFKKITNLVRAYHQEKDSQREIEQKRKRYNFENHEE